MADTTTQLSLQHFTFHSLEFSSTPVTTWQGKRLMSVVNGLYLPYIRDGWPVPLSFIVDVSTLLLAPFTTPQGFPHGDSRERRRLSLRYRAVLLELRKHPTFQRIIELLRVVEDAGDQEKVIMTFLRFLLAGTSGFENVYSFDTRGFRLRAAKITSRGVGYLFTDGTNQVKAGKVLFAGTKRAADRPELVAVQDVLQMLCQYFESTPLSKIVTPDLQLVIEIAARTPSGMSRVDYRLLSWLLNQPPIEDVEHHDPYPRLVDEFLPTNVHDFEGQTGGYIDVARRKFRGNVAEVLPGEMALWTHRSLAVQKLLNEGVVSYVRENFEFIERELRVMFCIVVDNSPGMMRTSGQAAGELGQGLTPYVRARALAITLIQDLMRFLPRVDVMAECGVFLWSPATSEQTPEPTCTGEIDLFALDRTEAASRLSFLRHMTDVFPQVFYSRVSSDDAEAHPELEADPWQFAEFRHQTRHFHCRHFLFLSSTQSLGGLLRDTPRIPVEGHDAGPDSIHLVNCDVDEAIPGVARIESLEHAWDFSSGVLPARMSESRFRHQFMNMVMLKGAGQPLEDALRDTWDDLP